MSGIIFFGIIGVWGFIAVKLAGLLTSRVESPRKKSWLYPLVLILIFVAPIMDEIIGGFQFRALCKPENILIYDEDKLKGRSVRPRIIQLKTINKVIPIVVTTGQWQDFETGELLVTYKRLRAKGGWLSRLIGFPQGSPPYTFDGSCSLKEYYLLFEKLDVTKIEN